MKIILRRKIEHTLLAMHPFLIIFCASIATAFVSISMMEYRLRSLHANKFDARVSLQTVGVGLVASICVYFIIYGMTFLLPMGPL